MDFPWNIKKYLDDHQWQFRIYPEMPPAEQFSGQVLTILYLEDSLGCIQYVLPHSHMLRLHSLAETLGRNFTCISEETQQKLLKQLELDQATGILPLSGLHTLVDRSVSGSPHYLLPSGVADSWLKIEPEHLEVLLREAQAEWVDFASDSRRPWLEETSDEDQILASVQNLTSLRIRQRLIETLEIPPLPDSARKILKLRLDPDARVEELASIIEKDPSLNAQVICWASSPYYASPAPVTTVFDAITRVLGFDMVMNMTLGLSLGKTLSLPKDGPSGLKPYWEQAAMTAYAMQRLVQAMPKPYSRQASTAYLCGLLHNFGFLILGHLFPLHFSVVCRHIEANPHVPISNIEYLLLGVTRNQLVSWLLQTWGMPEEVVIAIRYQDMPNIAPEPTLLTRTLHLSLLILAGNEADEFNTLRIPLEPEKANRIVNELLEEQSATLKSLATQMVG